ncbi:MAG TPA: hypothetical protein VF396_06110, partial [Bradyrhizobium sp.]
MDGEVIWVRSESEYFLMEDWTTQITLESLNKSSSDGIRNPVADAMLTGSCPASLAHDKEQLCETGKFQSFPSSCSKFS